MWIAKLKLRHNDCPIVNRCQEFNIPVYSYPSTWYEKKGKKYATTNCFFQNPDEKIKRKYLADLKKDKRITNVEFADDMFTYEIELADDGEHVMLYHSKQIIFVKPVVNHPDGHEYWEVASWEKTVLNQFIKDLKKHMNVCKIMRLEQSPIRDIYFPNIMPTLSEQQKKALQIAYNNNYYKYPRKITLQTLAKKAGIGISTYQEHLRKAEIKLLPAIIEQELK